jgi:Uma2 family endonuclease
VTSVSTRPLTIDEFLALPEQEEPTIEFLRGELFERPMSPELHGAALSELGLRLGLHARQQRYVRLGISVRFCCRMLDWVFLPDINVRLRQPGDPGPQRRGAVEGVPDMAVEVLSPDDRASRWLERVNLYMESGTKLLWVVDPEEQTIRVFRPGETSLVFRTGDVLDAEPVLKGFELDLADFFATVLEED